jgi:peroxiredoxin
MAQATATKVGDPAPALELPDTEGDIHTLPMRGEAPATVVFWTCNHCPYALAWQERLAEVGRDYGARGVRFLAVNSNDAERYPRDSLEAMRERVREEDWPFPYLHDESQQVARDWAAQVTPHVYVLYGDLRVGYEGAPDADHMDPAQNAAWLREALDDLLSGNQVSRAETEPVGCSIKWK